MVAKNKFRIEIPAKELVPNERVRPYYWWSLLLIIMMAGAVGGVWRYLPQTVPLLFTEPWGEARLVPKYNLFLLPILELLVMVTNLVVSRAVPKEHKALLHSLGAGTLATALMLSAALFGIVRSLL